MVYCHAWLKQEDLRLEIPGETIVLRGVIKKFVDWCDEIITYLAMLTNFRGNIKQQMFYQLWKVKSYSLIINHFITKNNLYGLVTRRCLHSVPWRSTTLLFFIVTLYTLRYFWLSTQKLHTNLNKIFYIHIKFDELLSQNVKVGGNCSNKS